MNNSQLMFVYKMKLIIFKIIIFLIVESIWSAKTKYSDKFKYLCGQPNVKPRIVGGSDTVEGEFPFIARILLNVRPKPSFVCDGSLITDRHILTASHCFTDQLTQTFVVSLGDYNVARNKLSEYSAFFGVLTIMFAGNIKNPLDTDIAIIKLVQQVKFNRWIAPICLPYKIFADSLIGEDVTVIGFGMVNEINGTAATILQKVQVTVRPKKDCRYFARPTPGQICAAGNSGKGSCYGDSGGPLFKLLKKKSGHRYVQVGIVSYGSDLGCGKETMYTDVNFYLEWIEKNLIK